jgi:type I restriction enzyme S subunit
VLSPVKVGPSFLYGITEREEFVEYLTSVADGSAYPAVRADRFEVAPIPLPSEAFRARYERLAMPLRMMAEASAVEAHEIERLRDSILPNLLSGELRVRDAEHLVEAVV